MKFFTFFLHISSVQVFNLRQLRNVSIRIRPLDVLRDNFVGEKKFAPQAFANFFFWVLRNF